MNIDAKLFGAWIVLSMVCIFNIENLPFFNILCDTLFSFFAFI